jgi:heptosyltransferase-1
MTSQPRRILLVRTSALGDLVHALPVLTALRRSFPQSRIAWVVEDPFAELLEGHPDLDQIVPVKLRTWRHAPLSWGTGKEVMAAVRSLRRFAPDVALDLMGNHKGGVLSLLSGARIRIGAERRYRREPSSAMWVNTLVEPRGEHSVDLALSLLEALDVTLQDPDFSGDRILRQDCPEATAFVDSQPVPYVLLQCNAGWGNKTYPLSWLARVGGEIRSQSGLSVYALAGPGEESLAQAVQEASHGAVQALSSPSLPHLATVARHARLLVGGDTGPLHLAHALGTEVLCLMGPTGPRRHGPYGSPERALWADLPCSPCHKRFQEARPCLLHYGPERVSRRARELLAGN